MSDAILWDMILIQAIISALLLGSEWKQEALDKEVAQSVYYSSLAPQNDVRCEFVGEDANNVSPGRNN